MKLVLCLFGLVDSGKTAVAEAMLELLPTATFIDAHKFRELFKNTDYSPDGRKTNIKNLSNFLNILDGSGIVILAFNIPTQELRQILKDDHDAKMVLCNASLDDCKRRDTKGLYSLDIPLPLRGSDFDVKDADFIINTGDHVQHTAEVNAKHCARQIIDNLVNPYFADYNI